MSGSRGAKPPGPSGPPRQPSGLDTWLARGHASGSMSQNQGARMNPAVAGDSRMEQGVVDDSDDEGDDEDDEEMAISKQLIGHASPQQFFTSNDTNRMAAGTAARQPWPPQEAALPRDIKGSSPHSASIAPTKQTHASHFSPSSSRPSQAPAFSKEARSSQSRGLPVNEDTNMDDDEDMDELAGEDEPLPLIMSDLDPKFQAGAHTTPGKIQPPGQQRGQIPAASPQLSIRVSQRPSSSSSAATPRAQGRSQPIPTTPSSKGKVGNAQSVSVSIPSFSPAGAAAAATPVRTAPLSAPKASPVVAVGRRTTIPTGAISGGDGGSTGVRIKGRPKGWKPGMSYREAALRNMGMDGDEAAAAAVLLPPPKKRGRKQGSGARPGRKKGSVVKPAPDYNSIYRYRRPGRPPLQPIESIQRGIFVKSTITYIPFLCEWAGCRAELQNMATLRKHVRVVHGHEEKCQWRKCGWSSGGGGGEDEKEEDGTTFSSLLSHMEYQHLAPVEWHQGDGFVNNSHLGTLALKDSKSGKDEKQPPPPPAIPTYLLGDDGQQVTPLMQDPQLQSAVLSWTQEERVRRLKDLYRQQQQQQHRRPDRGWSRLL